MRMLELKSQTQFLTHHACRRIAFNDAIVEWIDILFENAAGFPYCAPHSHDWFEFNYVAEGTMDTAFDDGIMQRMEAGDFVLIPPGTVHSHRYDAEFPHEGLCLRWRVTRREGAAADEIAVYDKLMRLKDWAPTSLRDEIGLGERLEKLLGESEAGEQAVFLQMSFVRLLLRLSESAASSARRAHPYAEKFSNGLVRKVDIFLGDLQDRELDVKLLAASLHLSYAHVAREFKRHTGRTILQRMTEIRLNKAIDLLLHSDLSMREVAEQAGFSSAYYFSRVFKAAQGVNPTRYRAEGAQQEESNGQESQYVEPLY